MACGNPFRPLMHTMSISFSARLRSAPARQPELCPFAGAAPQPQHLPATFQIHADCRVYRAVLHPPLVPHLHVQCIQKDDGVNLLQWLALLGFHLLSHRVGDLRVQRRADLHAVDLLQVTLDLARRDPARITWRRSCHRRRRSASGASPGSAARSSRCDPAAFPAPPRRTRPSPFSVVPLCEFPLW